MEDNELFGERHEQEENGLYGRKHAELCDLHNVIVPKGTFCELYKKECTGSFCSVTPNWEKCRHLKKQNAL